LKLNWIVSYLAVVRYVGHQVVHYIDCLVSFSTFQPIISHLYFWLSNSQHLLVCHITPSQHHLQYSYSFYIIPNLLVLDIQNSKFMLLVEVRRLPGHAYLFSYFGCWDVANWTGVPWQSWLVKPEFRLASFGLEIHLFFAYQVLE